MAGAAVRLYTSAVRLNAQATYIRHSGCIRLASGAVLELTVREEELFELLLKRPKVTCRWDEIERHMAASPGVIRHYTAGLRRKLGSRAIRTHVGIGLSLQPQFVATAHFRLAAARGVA